MGLLQSEFSFAAGTDNYEDTIVFSKHGYERYDKSGTLVFQMKEDKWIGRGKIIEYDSLGNLTAKGKTVFDHLKHGKWKFYENGKYIRKQKYKYGLLRSSLKNDKGKKIRCYLVYGMPGWKLETEESESKYGIREVRIAGCVVNGKILFKAKLHNFFVGSAMTFHYGFRWKTKAFRSFD